MRIFICCSLISFIYCKTMQTPKFSGSPTIKIHQNSYILTAFSLSINQINNISKSPREESISTTKFKLTQSWRTTSNGGTSLTTSRRIEHSIISKEIRLSSWTWKEKTSSSMRCISLMIRSHGSWVSDLRNKWKNLKSWMSIWTEDDLWWKDQ